MFRPTFSRIPRLEWLLLGFLLFSVLWRGGKSLETTWMLVGVATVLTLAEGTRESKEMENNVRVPWILAFGFLFWTTLSYFFSTTKNYGLDEVLRDGALILIFLWSMRHSAGESGACFLHRFTHTITVASVLGAFFGSLVYVMQPVNRFVGTFFDFRFHTDYWPNAWAQFVLLAWPMILLQMRGRSMRLQFAGCMVLGAILGTLLLSYSRGAMIAFAGQSILLAAWYWMQRARTREQGWKILASKVAVVLGCAVVLFFAANAVRSQFHPVQSIGEKITFSADEGGSSIDERRQFWAQSVRLISQRPLLGWGPYSFRFVHQRFQTSVLTTSDHPHNVFLKLAAERGVPTAILFVLLLLAILLPTLRSQCKLSTVAESQIVNRQSQMYFLLALLGVLAHNLIDFNLQFVGIALPFWMMLGMLGSESGTFTVERGKLLNKKLVHIFELSIAVVLLTVALREGAFLVTSSIGRHAEVSGDSETALRWYGRSIPEWFSRDMHLSRALLATTSGRTGTAQEAIGTFLTSNGEDPRGWRLMGDIAKANGDIPGAIEAYTKAYQRGRWNDVSITLALAETLVEDEQLEMMKSEMDALLSSFVEAIVHNAHFVALSHNAEDAIALSALLAEKFPDSAPRYEVLAARADFAMRAERTKVKSRPSGYLW